MDLQIRNIHLDGELDEQGEIAFSTVADRCSYEYFNKEEAIRIVAHISKVFDLEVKQCQ